MNLWPTLSTESKNDVTLTAVGDGLYHISGQFSSWTTFERTIPLEDGLYSIEASEGLTSFNSWDLLLQVSIPGGDTLIKPGPPTAYLPAGKYRCQINVNNTTAIGRTIRPVLYRVGGKESDGSPAE